MQEAAATAAAATATASASDDSKRDGKADDAAGVSETQTVVTPKAYSWLIGTTGFIRSLTTTGSPPEIPPSVDTPHEDEENKQQPPLDLMGAYLSTLSEEGKAALNSMQFPPALNVASAADTVPTASEEDVPALEASDTPFMSRTIDTWVTASDKSTCSPHKQWRRHSRIFGSRIIVRTLTLCRRPRTRLAR